MNSEKDITDVGTVKVDDPEAFFKICDINHAARKPEVLIKKRKKKNLRRRHIRDILFFVLGTLFAACIGYLLYVVC